MTRYVLDDGRRSFVLDASGSTALLRFDGAHEVYALETAPGPRGSVIYRLDTGRPMLRVAPHGGATAYTREAGRLGQPARSIGAADPIPGPSLPLPPAPIPTPPVVAAFAADGLVSTAEPLAPLGDLGVADPLSVSAEAALSASTAPAAPLDPNIEALDAALRITARRLERLGASNVRLDAASEPAGAMADALNVTRTGLVSADRLKPGSVASLTLVRVITGEAADVTWNEGVLTVTVAPDDGYAGRPSSARVRRAVVAGVKG